MKVIKRYANRRLYDSETSRTITLDEVANFIRSGEDIRVIDNISGEDITSKVLGQTFLKLHEPKGAGNQPLLNFLLKALIRESNSGFFQLVRKLMFAGIGIAGMSASERESLLKLLLLQEPTATENNSEQPQNWLSDLASRGQKETDKIWGALLNSLQGIQSNILAALEPIDKHRHVEEILRKIEKLSENMKSNLLENPSDTEKQEPNITPEPARIIKATKHTSTK